MWTVLCAGLVFLITNASLALAAAVMIRGQRPAVRLTVGLAGALTLQFLVLFAAYAVGVELASMLALPILALLFLRTRIGQVRAILRTREVRELLIGWAIVAGWSICALAWIRTYNGAEWVGDWIEHIERPRFFLHNWPLDYSFIGLYRLPARPPLCNVDVAGWARPGGGSAAAIQLLMTLFGSLAYLPTALLARRLGGGRYAMRWLTLVFLLNPFWVQNTTYTWTKQASAFFVVLAIERCIAGLRSGRNHGVAAALLAAGTMAHYSAGPQAIAIGLAWLAFTRSRFGEWDYWKRGLAGVAIGLVPVLAWLGWTAASYGTVAAWHDTSTFAFNTATDSTSWWHTYLLNLRYTILPAPDSQMWVLSGQQPNLWGRLRDATFLLYQQTLPLACGGAGLLALAIGAPRSPKGPAKRFMFAVILLGYALGLASHPYLVDVGLTHVCLQPLVLVLLARFAALLGTRPPVSRRLLLGLMTVDALLGIVLSIGLESGGLGARMMSPASMGLSFRASQNYLAKAMLHDAFLGDIAFPWRWAFTLAAIAVLVVAVRRAMTRAGEGERFAGEPG